MNRKIITIITTIFIFLSTSCFNVSAAAIPPNNISGDGIVLMDASSGQILYGKNVDEAFPPASTTKIMTALLTIENTKPTDMVTISNTFTQKNHDLLDGNSLLLKDGEQVSVNDLMHGLILRSANDSAVALAEHIGGSVQNFANMMNKRAKELGCTNTNFVNPNGLFNKEHKSSSKDMALILRQLSKYSEFRTIATTTNYTMAATNKTSPPDTIKNRTLTNENKLVYKNGPDYYPGIDGGKTGYTIQSLHSYVAAATRNNHRLIVVIMHSNDRNYFNDARTLFDYGFNNFDSKKAFSKGQILSYYTTNSGVKIPLVASKDFYYVSEKGSNSKPNFTFKENSIKSNTFHKGNEIASVTVKMNNTVLGSEKLLSGANYPQNTISTLRNNILQKMFTKQYILYISIFSTLLIAAFAGVFIYKKNNDQCTMINDQLKDKSNDQ
ncbi:MAG: D-alanyl-D-alanine carboxypeptidase [Clostridium sp.]|nr:D-alanyl-D-alanine carboxypeptidase [Clostridium sp.]